MKLISMTDYVLEQENPDYLQKEEFEQYSYSVYNYTKFLKQPLTLGMFVPCNLKGNILEEPKKWNDFIKDEVHIHQGDLEFCLQYQQAKERVLFVGEWNHSRDDRYTYMNWCEDKKQKIVVKMHDCKTIKDLIDYDLTLTESAIKQLGL